MTVEGMGTVELVSFVTIFYRRGVEVR